jgi:hypothetical protein
MDLVFAESLVLGDPKSRYRREGDLPLTPTDRQLSVPISDFRPIVIGRRGCADSGHQML